MMPNCKVFTYTIVYVNTLQLGNLYYKEVYISATGRPKTLSVSSVLFACKMNKPMNNPIQSTINSHFIQI